MTFVNRVLKVLRLLNTTEGHKALKYAAIKFSLLFGIAYGFIYYVLVPSTTLVNNYHDATHPLPLIAWMVLVMSSCIFLVFPFQNFVSDEIAKCLKCFPTKSQSGKLEDEK